MPRIEANGIEINYDRDGSGEPMVLVHGGWSDRNVWAQVAPTLARSHDVVVYDRRGHGLSRRGVDATRRDHEDDLAGLIEALDLGSPTLVGTSYGGSIALGLAARRPDLVRGLIVHEPPLMELVADDPRVQGELAAAQVSIEEVFARVLRGDAAGAARQFVEHVVFEPGAWELMPPELRHTMVDSAPAFVADLSDPSWAGLEAPGAVECPVLLTQGDESPEWFRLIVAQLARSIGQARVHTYEGSGHAPHETDPELFLESFETVEAVA